MIQYLVDVSLCSIGFIAFYYLALRDKNFHQWNRLFLNGSLVLSLLIPLLHIPITEILYVAQSMTKTAQVKGVAVTTAAFTLEELLITIYLIGCLIMLYRFIVELIQINRLISKSDKEKFPNYSLVKSEIEFPLCSFFNFIICEKSANITEYELEHELTHIRQKHSYDKVFIELMKIFLWFNPAIYIYQKNIHAVHEFLADEAVVSLFGKDSYQDYLIQSLKNNQLIPCTLNPFHSLIKDRLHMLNNKKESTKGIYLLALPIIACLVFFISCEKKTEVVAVDNEAFSKLNFNEEGNIIITDTILVFGDSTMEESVQYVTYEFTPEEYQEILKKNAISDSEQKSDLVTVVDTIVVFNEDTFEEKIRIVETQLTKDELKERERLIQIQNNDDASRRQEDMSLGQRINIDSKNVESDYVTVVDTFVIYNDETNQEKYYLYESQLTKEEFEDHNRKPLQWDEVKDKVVRLK
jgi:hypothetical protein